MVDAKRAHRSNWIEENVSDAKAAVRREAVAAAAAKRSRKATKKNKSKKGKEEEQPTAPPPARLSQLAAPVAAPSASFHAHAPPQYAAYNI